jgi:hypothetical protein
VPWPGGDDVVVSPWHSMPVHVPVDGSVVWVRRFCFGSAYLATWALAAGTFTAANGLVCSWADVWRWKHVTEPPP